MITFDENGEVIVNGKKVAELVNGKVSQSRASCVSRKVVIKNGKVVEDTTVENGELPDFDEIHSHIIKRINGKFHKKQSEFVVECEYCCSKYKSSEESCPNCGANNDNLTV